MTASIKFDRTPNQDSPTLWLSVVAGSLIVHLLVLLLGRWYFLRTPSAPAQGSRSSIDFVEVNPVPTERPNTPPQPQASSAPAVPSPPATSQAASTPPQREVAPPLPRTVESPLETPIQPRSVPSPVSPLPQASPRPSPVATPGQASRPSTAGQPTQPSSPAPSAPSGTPSPSSGGRPSPSSTTAPNPSTSGGSTSGGSTTTGTVPGPATGFPLPAPPNTSLPPVPDSSNNSQIGKAPVGSDPAPASFAVTVGLGDRPSDANVKEIPDELAQPKETTQSIETSAIAGECLLKPEATNFYTQTVKMRLAISEQGQVIGQPLVVQSSGSEAYDELAQCVIKRWEFIPAYNIQQDNSKNFVASNLDVPVRIDPK